ncbi:MAG: CopG family transcriptional regulator [Candidatus Micrarchaeota archaeon]|nr:CopG family transcriptional regulator [Candidatus Micrarchaeota archaeon]
MRRPNTSEKRKYTTITIPTKLFENIREKIKTTGFSSVSDYATYVLRETVAELNERSGKKEAHGVVEKLKALGYMS